LIRLHKCEALHLLADTIDFPVAEHAYGEFAAGGPSAKAALARLAVKKRPIVPGSPEWKHFALVRGEFSTVDLGEDQSIAIALAEVARDNPMPIVTYDDGAEKKARSFGVATVSFLGTLAWLVSCGLISVPDAEDLEDRAAARDGWRRPAAQTGPLAAQVESLCDALVPALEAGRKRKRKQRR
jgi:predicted nucleic acid-binding protein